MQRQFGHAPECKANPNDQAGKANDQGDAGVEPGEPKCAGCQHKAAADP